MSAPWVMTLAALASLPTRGAWIEITPPGKTHSAARSRSPHGERGLKCQDALPVVQAGNVAPHTGSVD